MVVKIMKFPPNKPNLYSVSEVMPPATVIPIAPRLVKQPAFISAADVQSSMGWFATYRSLLLILAYLVMVSVSVQLPLNGWEGVRWHETTRYFMAGFLLVFSCFKLLDLPAFADAYASYDVLAKRWRVWGLIYPFVELALGLAYLTNWNPLISHWTTLIVMGFSTIGVVQALSHKRSIRCAHLSAVVKLPTRKVTIIEDAGMVGMALLAMCCYF